LLTVDQSLGCGVPKSEIVSRLELPQVEPLKLNVGKGRLGSGPDLIFEIEAIGQSGTYDWSAL
jgi:hypothetical protein